tara:strand:- start:212 stop:1657 length:1446 start_codon:yes stop_codon:yes gene_type:complete
MSAIIHKYGKVPEPIYSVGAGYQSYYPWSKNFKTHLEGTVRRDTMGKRDSQILYYKTSATGERIGSNNIFDASPVLGYYAGNRILSERYKDSEAGFLTPTESDAMVSNFKSQYGGKALPILDSYLSGTRPNFEGVMDKAIKTSMVPAGEEQTRAIGHRDTPTPTGIKHIQPIDIANAPHFGNIQVTTERLQKNLHHGIYGDLGKKLGQNISELKTLHHKGIIDRDRTHKEIAKDGLNYFKTRLPTLNTALSEIKKDMIKAGKQITVKEMASEIQRLQAESNSTLAGKAATMVLQAIGNLQYFGKGGVTYSYAISPFTHVAISQFIMNPTTYQFDEGALRLAEVVDGTYDVTDMFFAQQSSTMTAQDVAEKRAFAHNHARVAGISGTTEVNALNVAHIGGHLANASRAQASIDMFHASKDMHHLITEGIIPEVRKALKNSGKKYSSHRLTKHKGSIKFGGKTGWALPYISIFDTALEKTGKR